MFIEEVWAKTLLEENGFDPEWAVFAYTSDLRAARQRNPSAAMGFKNNAQLDLVNRVSVLLP